MIKVGLLRSCLSSTHPSEMQIEFFCTTQLDGIDLEKNAKNIIGISQMTGRTFVPHLILLLTESPA